MNFDLYLKTRQTFLSPSGPFSLEFTLNSDCLTDFETLLSGIAAEASQLLARHDSSGVEAWDSVCALTCPLSKDWFPEEQAVSCVKTLIDVFSSAWLTYKELRETDEDAFEVFEAEKVPKFIRKYFDLSSILLDDEYEIMGENINDSNFFTHIFEVADIINDINLLLKPSNEEALRIYCEDRHCSLSYLASLNPKRFYDSVVVYKDKEEYARNWFDSIGDIPKVIEQNINWEGVYDDLTSWDVLDLVENNGTIYDFSNI